MICLAAPESTWVVGACRFERCQMHIRAGKGWWRGGVQEKNADSTQQPTPRTGRGKNILPFLLSGDAWVAA
jgi:hypothetical protein